MTRVLVATLLVCAAPAWAIDDELFGRVPAGPMEIGPIDMDLGSWQPQPSPPQPENKVSIPARFGQKGSKWLTVGTGIASDFDDSTDFNLRGAWSYFIADSIEFSAELNGWYFDQPGDNAFGINPAFVFRWHFFEIGNWSFYGDAGIGLLLSTDDTPVGGTSFNFTPRLGTGLTYRLTDDGTRLQVGVRWHHISNARLEGDIENPARDGVMFYTGVMIPF